MIIYRWIGSRINEEKRIGQEERGGLKLDVRSIYLGITDLMIYLGSLLGYQFQAMNTYEFPSQIFLWVIVLSPARTFPQNTKYCTKIENQLRISNNGSLSVYGV